MELQEWKEYIAKYQKENIYDPDRMSIKECIDQDLPYVTEDGKLINTHRFGEVGEYFQNNKVYTKEPEGSKAEVDFWRREKQRKRKGLWLGQLRVTGYHYFFLNYHRMKIGKKDENGNVEDIEGFGSFWAVHFWIFHLISFCLTDKYNFSLIKLRGCGLSELAASIGEADFLIPNKDSKGNIINQNNAYFASNVRYIGDDDGIFTKATRAIEWVNNHCNAAIFNRPGALMDNTSFHWVAGYRDKENVPHQTGGEIKATVVSKADMVRGGRKQIIFWEESGANNILGKCLSVAEGTTRRGIIKTGVQIIWGTSNEDSRGINAFKKVLQAPAAYDCLVFENVWEAVRRGQHFLDDIPWNPFDYLLPPGSQGVGFFIPAYEIKHMDKWGNPDRHKGYEEIMDERSKKLKTVSSDDEDVLTFFADYPLYMEEALMTTKGKRFGTDELSRHIVNIETKQIEPQILRGSLDYIKEKGKIVGVKWIDNPVGNIKILQHPEWVKNDGDTKYTLLNDPKRKWKLYLGGIDSIDQGVEDSSGEGSDLAYLIKKRRDPEGFFSDDYANAYVGLYRERPRKVRTGYDNVLKMMIYFNALSLLEYTKFNIKTHIVDIMKFPQYLAYEPSAPGTVIKNWRKNSRRQGIRVPKDVLNFYLGLIENYIEDYPEYILFKELLDEIVAYEVEHKTKFDLIAAMGMCEILDTEYLDVTPIQLQKEDKYDTLATARWYTDSSGVKRWGTPSQPLFRSQQIKEVLYYKKDGTPVYNE